jgi:hypothetical protein
MLPIETHKTAQTVPENRTIKKKAMLSIDYDYVVGELNHEEESQYSSRWNNPEGSI